jgi:hypothetical protein
MDKSGFGIGDQQAIKVLYTVDSPRQYKAISDKQE